MHKVQKHKDSIYIYIYLMASLWPASLISICLYKIIPPPQYLTIDCSHSALQYDWELSILIFIRLNF